jgi:DNA-binding MarR family transcriptional regulator
LVSNEIGNRISPDHYRREVPRTRRLAAAPAPAVGDHVDHLLEEWAAERPDLDVTPLAVVYRLTRLAAAWNAEIERVFARFGITRTDFAVLANLRRAGPPFQLSQRALAQALRLTPGTVSLRVDRLVADGLVERRDDPDDARAVLVTLTAAGHRRFDAVAPEHLANEAHLVAALSADEQAELARLLRAMLVEVEQPVEHRPDDALGVRVAPAAEAARRRAAVGLPRREGLLVESVRPDGPAGAAGITAGDLLVAVDGVPVRSLTCLERALARRPRRVDVSYVRGAVEREVVVAVEPDRPRRPEPFRAGRRGT